jgi:RNA polymerase sigma-70 factor (ECF subfamily)
LGNSTDRKHGLRDQLLVVRCQLGERDAFEELIRAWSPPLLRHAQRVAGGDGADDIVQEVWLRALRGIPRLREGAKLRPWLFGIAHRVMMDRLRVLYVERGALDELAEAPDEEELDCPEPMFELLETELARLPIIERETLTLFYLEDLPLQQVAEVQNVPVGTVKSRLFRARAFLRQSMLQGVGDER